MYARWKELENIRIWRGSSLWGGAQGREVGLLLAEVGACSLDTRRLPLPLLPPLALPLW